MIELEQVSARARSHARSRIERVSLRIDQGVFAVLGRHSDGTTALLEAVCGQASLRSGAIRIDQRDVRSTQNRVHYVPRRTVLPAALRVREAWGIAERAATCVDAWRTKEQGAGAPTSAMSTVASTRAVVWRNFDLERIADVPIRSLSYAHVRALALAVAFASSVRVLAIDEPFADIDGPAVGAIREAIGACVRQGRIVLVTTASVRDASRVADNAVVLVNGSCKPVDWNQMYGAQPRSGASVTVVTHATSSADGAAAKFLAFVAQHVDVTSVRVVSGDAAYAPLTTPLSDPDAPHDAGAQRMARLIELEGRSPIALARAVNEAIAQTQLPVEAMYSSAQTLEGLGRELSKVPSSPEQARGVPVSLRSS